MSEKQIKKLIRSLADEKAPGETIDLWPAINDRLQNPEGRPRRNWRSRLRIAGAALGLAVLLTGVVFLLTPQGQAWAQDTFQFFTKTESDRISFDLYHATQAARTSTATSEETSVAGEAEATPTSASQVPDGMTIEEVQALAGFVPFQPYWLPESFEFAEAFYDEETKVVTLMYYRLGDVSTAFGLKQEPFAYLSDCDICSSVGTSADIEKVSINGAYGAYVEGVWTGEEGDSVWKNDQYMKRMIWQLNGMAFELAYNGFPAYMLKEDMIEIAEGVGTLESSTIRDNLTLEEVQTISGVQIYQPARLPDGFEFTKALYDQENNVVTLMYYYGGNVNNAIGLKMEPISDPGTCYLCRLVGSSARVQKVSIQGADGEYVEGVWTLEDGEVVWKSYSYYTIMKSLIWQTDEMIFELNFMGNTLTKMDLVEIADSVNLTP
ncbi:DUF4367 domain-containing protein [bacterium]|nr:DUF4367 domain-containing protein [bacterium]